MKQSSCWERTLKWAAVYVTGAYIYDVLWRPAVAARQARAYADSMGKPVLNIGAGTSGSSFRAWLLGPTLWGDVNLDIAVSADPRVQYGDVQRIPYPDKYFGAAIASHVVEHVDDPVRAVQELHRVADKVYILVPPWWAPHTWLHPGHQWFVSSDGAFHPLWQRPRAQLGR